MDGGQAMLDNLQKLALNADQSRRPKRLLPVREMSD